MTRDELNHIEARNYRGTMIMIAWAALDSCAVGWSDMVAVSGGSRAVGYDARLVAYGCKVAWFYSRTQAVNGV